jgi:hypothetical protein
VKHLSLRSIVAGAILGGGLFTSMPVLGINENCPVWTALMVANQEVQYFRYDNGNKTETASSTGFGGSATPTELQNTSRPPTSYAVIGGQTATTRATCQITDRPSKPVYWYSGSTSLDGDYPNAPQAEFNASLYDYDHKGIEFRGQFEGSGLTLSSGEYIVQTVYHTDRACTDASLEYGIARVVTPDSDKIVFYWSDYTNCEGNVCREYSDGSGVIPPKVEMFEVTNLAENVFGEHEFFFHIYPVWDSGEGEYDMRFEIIDPYLWEYATCQVDGGASGDCEGTKDPGNVDTSAFWSGDGYAVAGTVAWGDFDASGYELVVQEVKVGK